MKMLFCLLLTVATLCGQRAAVGKVDTMEGLWQGYDGEWGHVVAARDNSRPNLG